MSEELTVQKNQIALNRNGLQLANLDDMWRFSQYVVASGFAPKGMERPESILIAVEMGYEVGLSPMAALQNTAVVNGRPTIYGDAALALVRASGLLERYEETPVGTKGKDDFGFCVKAKRKGDPSEYAETFTVADAKQAQLWGKPGPWSQYPARMLKFRARGFLLRDAFGDVLKGMRTAEEAMDYDIIDITDAADIAPKAQKLFTKSEPIAEPKIEPIDDDFTPPNPPVDESGEPTEQAEDDAPESALAELARRLRAAGLTKAQCLSYAKKNGLTSAGKVDEFAATKILNAWDTVSGFIGKEDK